MDTLTPIPASILKVKTIKGDLILHVYEILYLKAINKNTLVHLINGDTLETRQQLKWYEERLNMPMFCRCHYSYIVNCYYVEYICGNSTILKPNQVFIPVARERKQFYKDNLALFKQQQFLRILPKNTTDSDNLHPTQ
jgi:Response regulator of the LytR/AlgR family